jgi:hypothetical protein
MSRNSSSKKLRFDVFKRDGFTCQYCGAHPPNVILEADHVIPAAGGGKAEIDNLVTACFDCNRGKGKTPLDVIPQSLQSKAEETKEREAQLAGYRKIIQKKVDREEADCWRIAAALLPGEREYINRDWFQGIKNFARRLDLHEILDAAETALARIPYSESKRFRYFCGICWNKIRDMAESNG